jgi:hypothetical protein
MHCVDTSKDGGHVVTEQLAIRRFDTLSGSASGEGLVEPSWLGDIAQEVFANEIEAARRTGNLGYMARVLAQVTLPHSKPEGNEYVRRNGRLTLSVLSPSHVGLPYGGLPRIILSWLTTEAVRTRDRTLVLGPTLSRFMDEIGLTATGGRWGTIPRLHNQLLRLFASRVFCTYDGEHSSMGAGLDVASRYQLWWDPKDPHQATLWQSTVTLGQEFFDEIIDHPVPIDTMALRVLKRSPLALDLYVWMTYRYSYLDKPVLVPWLSLHGQFGADYIRLRKFREKMLEALSKVSALYPEARFEASDTGLRLLPSKTHVGKLPSR